MVSVTVMLNAPTLNPAVLELDTEPDVPVRISVYEPGIIAAPSLNTVAILRVVVAPAAVGVIVVAPKVAFAFCGTPESESVTGEEKPATDVTVTVYLAVPPAPILLEPAVAGASDTVKLGGVVTTSVAVPVSVIPPPTPVTVNTVLPVGVTCRVLACVTSDFASFDCNATALSASSVSEVAIARVAVAPVAVGVRAPKVGIVFAGSPDADRAIAELNPPVSVIVTV